MLKSLWYYIYKTTAYDTDEEYYTPFLFKFYKTMNLFRLSKMSFWIRLQKSIQETLCDPFPIQNGLKWVFNSK